MKTRKLPLFFLVFFTDMCMVSQIAYGAENGLFLEAGPGVSQSLKSEAVLVRFQRDSLQIFGHQSFFEGLYMHWDGHNHDDAVGLAGGIRWTVTGDSTSVPLSADAISAGRPKTWEHRFSFISALAAASEPTATMFLSLSYIFQTVSSSSAGKGRIKGKILLRFQLEAYFKLCEQL
jgi:hypothetical protein